MTLTVLYIAIAALVALVFVLSYLYGHAYGELLRANKEWARERQRANCLQEELDECCARRDSKTVSIYPPKRKP